MAHLSIFKETVLPESLQPNAMYLVAPAGQPDYVEIYVTSNDGAIVRKTIGETEILGLINTHIGTAVQSVLEFKLVQDIVTRDALALDKATLVLVIDASADPTVEAGAATYIYNPDDEDYTKIAEYESLDISLDWDAFGFMLLSKDASFSDAFAGRWFRSKNGNYPNQSFMIFTTAQKVLGQYFFDLYGKEYINNVQSSSFRDNTLNIAETIKPQGIYTVYRQNGLSYFLRQQGFATEQELIDHYVAQGVPEQEFIPELNEIKKHDSFSLTTPDISLYLPSALHTENTDLYLIMTPYVGTHAASFNLDPTSQIQISYDLVNVSHSAPNDAVDGDILHLTEKASISGKIISKDSFLQLYANKTKYIPLSGTVK